MSVNLQQWELRFADFIGGMEHADDAHDIEHVKRVVHSAKAFAEAEGADMEVVLPAAWLHDCVAVAKNSPLRKKASGLAADKAAELLADWGYPTDKLDAIKHAIEAHSFSANIPTRTLEAQVVQDADRMDGIGAIGLVRALLVGAQMGNPLYHAEDPFCEQREADDAVSIIDHFYTKLLKLKDSFHTDAARAEAQSRHDFMQQFLQQLGHEVL